jgi:hypothetical protein
LAGGRGLARTRQPRKARAATVAGVVIGNRQKIENFYFMLYGISTKSCFSGSKSFVLRVDSLILFCNSSIESIPLPRNAKKLAQLNIKSYDYRLN